MDTPHNSLFSGSIGLDEERTQANKEFDAKHEAEVFANALIKNNSLISASFEKLCAPLKEWTGGHFGVLPTQAILWLKALHREHLKEGASLGIKWTFYVIWPLRHGSSDGHGTNQRIIARIDAEQITIMQKDSVGLAVKSDHLHLKFMGFCSAQIDKLSDSVSSTPFDNIYPNIPSRLLPPETPL